MLWETDKETVAACLSIPESQRTPFYEELNRVYEEARTAIPCHSYEELNDVIRTLADEAHRALEGKPGSFGRVQTALKVASTGAPEIIRYISPDRYRGRPLPDPDTLDEDGLREIITRTTMGGYMKEGQRRPGGKRDPSRYRPRYRTIGITHRPSNFALDSLTADLAHLACKYSGHWPNRAAHVEAATIIRAKLGFTKGHQATVRKFEEQMKREYGPDWRE